MSPHSPGVLEQLSRLALVSATLLRRAWLPAAGAMLAGAIGAAAVFALAGLCALAVPRPGDLALVTAMIGAGPLLALLIALVVVGPLATFTLAREHEQVGLGAVAALARTRVRTLALVILLVAITFLAVSGVVGTLGLIGGLAGIPLALAYALGPLYGFSPAFLALGEVVASEEPPSLPIERAWVLARGHRTLTLMALGASAIPAVAASSNAFTTAVAARSLAMIVPLAGGALSLYAFALLAVAAHAVASGEGGEDA